MLLRNTQRLSITSLVVVFVSIALLVALSLIPGAAIERTAAPSPEIPPELVLQRFPIAGHGSPVLLPVRVAGRDHLFVVDSGCRRTVLDLSLPLGRPRRRGTVLTFNGNVEAAVYDPPDATVGRLPLRVAEVTGADLSRTREAWRLPIEGILGMDFLGDYVLRIDFDKRQLLFLKSVPRDAGAAVPIEWQPGEIPRVMAEFSDTEKVRFFVDTGWLGATAGPWGRSRRRDCRSTTSCGTSARHRCQLLWAGTRPGRIEGGV